MEIIPMEVSEVQEENQIETLEATQDDEFESKVLDEDGLFLEHSVKKIENELSSLLDVVDNLHTVRCSLIEYQCLAPVQKSTDNEYNGFILDMIIDNFEVTYKQMLTNYKTMQKVIGIISKEAAARNNPTTT